VKNKKMRFGRDFTNMLNTLYLTEEERLLLKEEKLKVPDMDARVQIKVKSDLVGQIKFAKELGVRHIEIDGGIPNPYLSMSESTLFTARETAKIYDITLSFHLPYTFVANSIASFQEEDRKYAVELLKRYIDQAAKLGCVNCVLHPGSIPFYQATGEYLNIVKESLYKSYSELAQYSYDKNVMLHLENNTAFDFVMVEIEDNIELLERIDPKGEIIKYCYDIGHWFTRADVGKEVPTPPEKVFELIPEKYIGQMHLNDYIPVVKKFHPPLYYEKGLLKKQNLINLLKIMEKKKVKLVIVETAVREINELLSTKDIILREQNYLKEVCKEAGVVWE
jgi:sugar phosphate isomerase/epimerase